MDERRFVPAAALQFSLACGIYTVVVLMSASEGTMGTFYPLSLLVFAPGIYFADCLFLRRERTMRALAILNVGLAVVLFVLSLVLDGMDSWAELLFRGLFCIWPAVYGWQLALEPPNLHSMTVCLDLSLVLLVVFTGFAAAADLSLLRGIPMAAGCASAVLGLMVHRMNRNLRPRDWGLLLLAFGGLAGVLVFLLAVAARPAGQGLVAAWNLLLSICQWLLSQAGRLLLFLVSLIPAPKEEYGEIPEYEPIPEIKDEPVEPNPMAGLVLLVLSAVFLLAVVLLLLRRLGRLRVGGEQRKQKVRARRPGRLPFRRALKRALEAWRQRRKERAFLRRERDTALGVFYTLVRQCRRSPWRKRPQETPREFLTRMQGQTAADPVLSSAIGGLIIPVERALYARNPEWERIPEARRIRRSVRTAVWKQVLREQRTRLRDRLRSAGEERKASAAKHPGKQSAPVRRPSGK